MEKSRNKECVLYDRMCTGCGECDMCDLDPSKVCDNCGKCIDSGSDYNIVDVDLQSENGGMPLNYSYDEDETENEYAEEDEIDTEDLASEFGELFGKNEN